MKNELEGKEPKVLKFFEKFGVKAIKYSDFEILLNSATKISKELKLATEKIESLETTIEDQKQEIKKLNDQQLELIDKGASKLGEMEDSIKSLKKLLEDKDNKIADLNERINELETPCLPEVVETKPEVVEDLSVNELSIPTEDKVEPAITFDAYLSNLTLEGKEDLKSKIVATYSNDKRLSKTLNNWITKYGNDIDALLLSMYNTIKPKLRGDMKVLLGNLK